MPAAEPALGDAAQFVQGDGDCCQNRDQREQLRRRKALGEMAGVVADAGGRNVELSDDQYEALLKAFNASSALLDKYTVKAPDDGVILSVNAAVGGYMSSQGIYDSYTQGFDPSVVMGGPQDKLGLRCYIDEILVHQMPSIPQIHARMFIRGTNVNIPLEYVRIQPYVSPKIELSDQRLERVDVRVLPVIFKFDKPKDLNLYPGQLVDVYIEAK